MKLTPCITEYQAYLLQPLLTPLINFKHLVGTTTDVIFNIIVLVLLSFSVILASFSLPSLTRTP